MCRFASVLILVCCMPQQAKATNRGFLPGDAFFHAVLTQELCKKLVASDTPTLEYVRPQAEEWYLCGFAGYWNLQLPADSQPLLANLSQLFRH